jgi:hypothetical protein
VAADSEARGQAKANSDPAKSSRWSNDSRWSNESNRSHGISLVEEIRCSTTPDSAAGIVRVGERLSRTQETLAHHGGTVLTHFLFFHVDCFRRARTNCAGTFDMKCECVQRAECNYRSTVDDRRSGSSSWLSVGGRVQPRVQTSARRDTRRFAAGGIEVANPFQRLLPATDSASANRLDHLRKAG